MKLVIENQPEQNNNPVSIETINHRRFIAETRDHGICFFYRRDIRPYIWFMIGESASVHGISSTSAGFTVRNPRPAEISEIKVILA